MKRTLLYFAVGLIAFVWFTASRLPASMIASWAGPGITGTGFAGTVWRGSARSFQAGKLSLGQTSWDFLTLALFRGELAFALESRIGSFPVVATASAGLGGQLRLRDVSGRVPLDSLRGVIPSGFFDGVAEVDFERIVFRDQWPVAAEGRLQIDNLLVLTMRPPVLLGTFTITFENQSAPPLTGILQDASGPLDLEGSLVLHEDGRYELLATIAERPDAGRPVQQVLSFLGPADASGRRTLRQSGTLRSPRPQP